MIQTLMDSYSSIVRMNLIHQRKQNECFWHTFFLVKMLLQIYKVADMFSSHGAGGGSG